LPTHQLAGMGTACALARERLDADPAHIGALREALWAQLQALPRIHRNTPATRCAPHVLNVSFEGVDGESLRARLHDVAVSSGSACSSATREASYVLRALGRDDELASSSLRFSLGRTTTRADIDAAARRVVDAVTGLRGLSPLWSGA
jgi:cysteine desulfurase